MQRFAISAVRQDELVVARQAEMALDSAWPPTLNIAQCVIAGQSSSALAALLRRVILGTLTRQYRKHLRRRVGFRRVLGQSLDNLGMLRRHILCLTDIAIQVVQFPRRIIHVHMAANGFPLARAHHLLLIVARELPIEIVMLSLFAAEQRRREADAIDVVWNIGMHHVAQRW